MSLLILTSVLAGCSQVEPGGTSATADVSSSSATTTSSTTTSTKTTTPLTLEGIPPGAIAVGSSYDFQPTVSQASGALAFSIQGQPAWTAFDTATGALSGTPSASNVGLSGDITITATNGSSTGSVGPFTILVVAAAVSTPPPSQTPQIIGTPATSVPSGQFYSFQPTASGGAGTPLTFSIVNCPRWAAFSTATGALTGTPIAAQVGTYSNIQISVSNGNGTATLPAFAIAVTPAVTPVTGTATLQWVAPTLNTNGSSLTDLSGYFVYWGTNPGSLTQSINVTDATATSYIVSGLTAGTWYFAVEAYDSQGNSSAMSNVASKTL